VEEETKRNEGDGKCVRSLSFDLPVDVVPSSLVYTHNTQQSIYCEIREAGEISQEQIYQVKKLGSSF
jgi:hypothetical protein